MSTTENTVLSQLTAAIAARLVLQHCDLGPHRPPRQGNCLGEKPECLWRRILAGVRFKKYRSHPRMYILPEQTNTKRFTVHHIEDIEEGDPVRPYAFKAAVLAEADTKEEAQKIAAPLGHARYYGVVIWDHLARVIR
jgi:hypothetical protein